MTELHVGDRVVVMPFTPDSEPGQVVDEIFDGANQEIPEGYVAVATERGWVLGVDPRLVRKVPDGADRMGNLVAREGNDRCSCGSPYWEFDTCIDCRALKVS